MYIVIAGAGLMGLTLAEELVARRHDVLLIDPDPAVCEFAHTEIGAMVHCGSATSTKTLEATGLRRADIAVGMMRNDADNLAFILLAQSLGVPTRIVRMREREFKEPYRLAGATTIASAVAPLVDQVLMSIEYPKLKALMRIGRGNIHVFQVTVPEDAQIAGMTVEAIARTQGLPPTCNFVAVEPPGGVMEITRGATLVPGGSTVIMLAMEADLQLIVELLTRSAAPCWSELRP